MYRLPKFLNTVHKITHYTRTRVHDTPALEMGNQQAVPTDPCIPTDPCNTTKMCVDEQMYDGSCHGMLSHMMDLPIEPNAKDHIFFCGHRGGREFVFRLHFELNDKIWVQLLQLDNC